MPSLGTSSLRESLRRACDWGSDWRRHLREIFEPPPWTGTKLTAKRRFNLYLGRIEHRLGRTTPWSRPVKLTVESTNVCNLRCPACFTGAGEVGRARSDMSLELYRSLLEELGEYLCELEFYNWGEPLLCKNIDKMVAEANQMGISTTISTNLSIPFDSDKAERLVESGLTVLGVSIDGGSQETYEQYRRGGELEKVLHNCRLLADAKSRLGSDTPRVIWEFHLFPHNIGDIDQVRALASEIGMEVAIGKGWLIGPDWDPSKQWPSFGEPIAARCPFLWGFAVVNNDGGVAPCCGTFYPEDDMGTVAADSSANDASGFREIWRGERFRKARQLFHRRTGDSETRRQICFDCPNTIIWEKWVAHRAAGGSKETFDPGYSTHEVANYFWNRRPSLDSTRKGYGQTNGTTGPD